MINQSTQTKSCFLINWVTPGRIKAKTHFLSFYHVFTDGKREKRRNTQNKKCEGGADTWKIKSYIGFTYVEITTVLPIRLEYNSVQIQSDRNINFSVFIWKGVQ